MASIDPSLIPDPKGQKWIAEMSEILNHQLEIDIKTTPSTSIFQIPESMTTQKPEAYEPQHIGLGPIHHFRSIPYMKMEQKKLFAVQRVLQYHNIKEFKLTILDKVQKHVPSVRASYDTFLQEDNAFLAWVFAIDGLFLLDLFHTYNVYEEEEDQLIPQKKISSEYAISVEDEIIKSDDQLLRKKISYEGAISFEDELRMNISYEDAAVGDETMELDHHFMEISVPSVTSSSSTPRVSSVGLKVDLKRRLLARDVIMLENQIPFVVLKEIHETLNSSSGNFFDSDNNFSPSIYRTFSDIHSPLKLCSPLQAPSHVEHLLQYMYYSIVNNVPLEKDMDDESFMCVGASFNPTQNIPKDEIVQLYNKTITCLEVFTINTTTIPSASTLHDKSGFSFHQLPKDEGIQKIVIKEKNFFLPSITLNNDSEVILRNLVAYEMIVTNSHNFPLIEYVRLMCELIVNAKDVKLLKEKDIIKGDLGEDEVAKLFIGMSSLIKNIDTKKKSELQEQIDEVKKVYESRLIMKAHLLLKKLALWLLAILKAIGGFVESSWKIVVFVIGIVSVFTLVQQAYCDSFGCDKTKVVKLLQYV